MKIPKSFSGGGTKPARPTAFRLRLLVLFVLMSCAALGLVVRAVELQLVNHDFLTNEGNQRSTRVVAIAAHRGMITDRSGEPLAVSTPVDSVWINPKELLANPEQMPTLAHLLGEDRGKLMQLVSTEGDRDSYRIKRGVEPGEAFKIKDLGIEGLTLTREYRRYYPASEVTGHLLGFTDADDTGQEGVELAYDHWLGGEDGAKRVIQDKDGHKVEDIESIRAVRPGRDLALSIDLRIQYLAYRELKAAVRDNHAQSGSVVVMDVQTGEVLAMVNQPAFNPNDRSQLDAAVYRNRAATDLFEPGSSIKPFVVAAGLASGRYNATSQIDTNPGSIKVGVKTFSDEHNLGVVPLSTILAKSSNVGMALLALSLEPRQIWATLNSLGFGLVSASGYPGESAGQLSDYSHWRDISIATLSHGYGLQVTPLQLAQAYATIGAMGIRRPVSLQRVDGPVPGQRVLDESVCRTLLHLLESVVTEDGTGVQAQIPGYRVAGKTGTAYIAIPGGYSTDRYFSIFGGVVPVSHPRLAAVIVIVDPTGGQHMGGDVAAPVFASILGGALRLLAVPPDDVKSRPADALLVTPKMAKR
jgi:cell division protein FtsI (penicillin-binding protein 3)